MRAWHHLPVATVTEPAQSRLINRELSAVEFYARVLELAEDDTLPLLERVKFAAIFAQFIDEFFMIRVAGLLELEESEVAVRSADGMAPGAALRADPRARDASSRGGRRSSGSASCDRHSRPPGSRSRPWTNARAAS